MTSRERIVNTLQRKPADRTPIDFGGTGTTGIHAEVYNGIRKLLGIEPAVLRIPEFMSQLAYIDPEVLDSIGGDVVALWRLSPCMGLPVTGYRESILSDGTPCLLPEFFLPVSNEKGDLLYFKPRNCKDYVHPYPRGTDPEEYNANKPIAICPKGYKSFCRVYHPLTGVETTEELAGFIFPDMDEAELTFLESEAKRLYETTDKAVCGIFNGNPFELGQLYWGHEDFFTLLLTESELMEFYFDLRTELLMLDLKKYLERVGKYIQVIQFTEDLGSQTSLLISPDLYRKAVKPYHRRMFDFVKNEYPHVKILLHSCGAVFDLIPDFIEMGVDALNPVQTTAVGMDPERLKSTYGRDIVFWGGGIDTQGTLSAGTREDNKAYVSKSMSVLAPGGGYIFSQVHNVEGNVPAENLLEAFRTAQNIQNNY